MAGNDSKQLTRISHRVTVEARDRRDYFVALVRRARCIGDVTSARRPTRPAGRRAPPQSGALLCTDAPLTHFASPRGEKSGLLFQETL